MPRKRLRIPYYRQQTDYTCVPATFRMALATYGKRISESYLARLCGTTAKRGTSNWAMSRAMRRLNWPYLTGYRIRYNDLTHYTKHGIVIVDWSPQLIYPEHPEFQHSDCFNPEKESHVAIVISAGELYITLQDPVLGRRVRVRHEHFIKAWRNPRSKSRHWIFVVLPKEKE
jgi:predicted double-glycine peptidase